MRKKVCIALIAIIAITACISALIGFIGRHWMNKEQMIQFVLDNEEFLNKAVEEIFSLDEFVTGVANTRFLTRIQRDELGFEGLYVSGRIDSRFVRKPLDNPTLYELLNDRRIRRIRIWRIDCVDGISHHIQFSLRGRGIRYRYEGVYFSQMNVPITFDGEKMENPDLEADRWVTYGNHYYYTERIVAHWFYYFMLFQSDRIPE